MRLDSATGLAATDWEVLDVGLPRERAVGHEIVGVGVAEADQRLGHGGSDAPSSWDTRTGRATRADSHVVLEVDPLGVLDISDVVVGAVRCKGEAHWVPTVVGASPDLVATCDDHRP